jgi:hypothetical protein
VGRGSILKSVSSGQHEVSVRADDYAPFDTTVDVRSGARTRLRAELSKKTGRLRVTTDPAEASILVDGKLIGTGSASKKVDLGIHTIVGKLDGYSREKKVIEIRNELERVEISLERKGSPLNLKVDPKKITKEGDEVTLEQNRVMPAAFEATECKVDSDSWKVYVKGSLGEKVFIKNIRLRYYEDPEKSETINWGNLMNYNTNYGASDVFGVDREVLSKREFPISNHELLLNGPGHDGFAVDLIMNYKVKGVKGSEDKKIMELICTEDEGIF